jgi:hypothetical protein
MPKTALADTIDEGRSLLAALAESEDFNLPHLRELHEQLESSMSAILDLAAEQAELQARRQAVTQQLRITRRKTQDLVIKTRLAIKGQLGHRSELLVRYRMRPIRRRSRAKDEEIGIAVFPRPDLLPAAGLAPKPRAPRPRGAAIPAPASGEAAEPDPGPISLAPAAETPEEDAPSSK